MLLKRSLYSTILMVALCAAICAQSASDNQTRATLLKTIDVNPISVTPTAQDPLDELRKQALILADNKKLKEENAGLKDENEAVKGQRDSALALVSTWKTISSEWQTAATERKGALGTSSEIVGACQTQLAKADSLIAKQEARIYSLEHPGLLKELFEPKQLIKIGGAFWLGRVTAPKN